MAIDNFQTNTARYSSYLTVDDVGFRPIIRNGYGDQVWSALRTFRKPSDARDFAKGFLVETRIADRFERGEYRAI